ncbi:MAG: threonylcarbamoyl-AMP synthase [Candidatus Diapherotrites archaeon CG11_big_fil_rev_8_21_14_0_20_37_9]|nr:MAG: threonylcarbamoyl-AMP synthase [Candidatus Diapherotrites archaeon CG11_big_fil_rev_8_21_14_0_20_37_9]
MKTKILKINSKKPEKKIIKNVARIMANGGIVAFPTETVYGLGANALDAKSVRKIFKAKGRPSDDPLIVHISEKSEMYELAKEVPEKAEKLIKKFWPGPLTVVLKKKKIVPNITTGNLDTVAIRMPKHLVAIALIKELGKPIAAPSANSFGNPSPTKAQHVLEDLEGKIPLILDSGQTKIGVESTVMDFSQKKPMLLRPGKVTLEQIEKEIGKIKVHSLVKKEFRKNHLKEAAKSPGLKYRHYAPKAEIIIVQGTEKKTAAKIQELLKKFSAKKIGILSFSGKTYNKNTKKIGSTGEKIAKNLFKSFREFDKTKTELIIAESIPEKEIGLAVMNRLKKAAAKIIKAGK